MNSRISVGDDTATGEPENGPRGPYITADDDGTHAKTSRTKTNATKKQPLDDGTARQTTASTQGKGWEKRANDSPEAQGTPDRPKGPAQP